jgi:hypothetical protein
MTRLGPSRTPYDPAMTVLTKREVWRRSAPLALPDRADLTPDERANLARALLFLRVRAGSWAKLAGALRVNPRTLERATGARARGTASLALRVAGVSVEAVLGGAWPPEGACAHCGRGNMLP